MMKEFIDKLIERLEEEHERCINRYGIVGGNAPAFEVKQCMEIITELAEEYINTSTEHINCSTDTSTKSTDCSTKVSEMPTGWIACSERLPEDETKRYVVQEKDGHIDILGFTKDAFKQSKFDFYEYKGKKKALFYDWDSEYGYIERECKAWMPLPAPYTEGE